MLVHRVLTVIVSVAKGAKVAHAVAFELVSLEGDKDLVVFQTLGSSPAGRLLVSAQLMTELPLPARRGSAVTIRAGLCRLGLKVRRGAAGQGGGHCCWYRGGHQGKI